MHIKLYEKLQNLSRDFWLTAPFWLVFKWVSERSLLDAIKGYQNCGLSWTVDFFRLHSVVRIANFLSKVKRFSWLILIQAKDTALAKNFNRVTFSFFQLFFDSTNYIDIK